MVDEVWLHIGTPKSGTSSLQKHLLAQREALSQQGVAYLTPLGKSSANDLAVAINKNRDDLTDMAAQLNSELNDRSESRAVISSEMFYGMAPQVLFDLLPALTQKSLKIAIYLRRQDRYIEAKYLQKAKNGRFRGSVFDFIEHFQGSGSDFAAEIAPWEMAGAQVEVIPRVLERDRLVGGDVVADFYAQMGLPAPEASAEKDVNVSPGLHRVQLLQAAERAGLANPRKLQRALAQHYPQAPQDRAPVLTQGEKREFLSRYVEGNESLRLRYFPQYDSLFDESDLGAPDQQTGIPLFTDSQLREVTRLLKVIKSLR